MFGCWAMEHKGNKAPASHPKIPLDKVMPQSSSEILSISLCDRGQIWHRLGVFFCFVGATFAPENLGHVQHFANQEGVDIRLTGEPSLQCGEAPQPKVVAIQPATFRFDAQAGGQGRSPSAGWRRPVLRQNVHFSDVCSPVSGTVKEVVRGAKRRILAVTVASDGAGKSSFWRLEWGDRDALLAHMAAGGAFAAMRQRPFDVLANPADTPRAFTSAGSNRPPWLRTLAWWWKDAWTTSNAALMQRRLGRRRWRARGNPFQRQHPRCIERLHPHRFAGPHPAGNVGVQIHHRRPSTKARCCGPWGCRMSSILEPSSGQVNSVRRVSWPSVGLK